MKLLVTRPEPGARATTARLTAMGHEAVSLPCLTMTPIPLHLSAPPAALVVTSGQAVPALPADLHGLPVFCVGDATADKLRMAGFTRVESAQGDAQALARLVITRNLHGVHVLAVGARHGLALAAQLQEAGLSVLRRRVYSVRRLSRLPAALRDALAAHEFDGALFYSAETAAAFTRLKPPGTAHMRAYLLSPNIKKGLQECPWLAIHSANAPTEADLMALLV